MEQNILKTMNNHKKEQSSELGGKSTQKGYI